MQVDPRDVKFQPIKQKGIHAGGQNCQKVANSVRATHMPTGIVVIARSRSLQQSKKQALQDLGRKIQKVKDDELAVKKKTARDQKIKDCRYIRTYNFKTQTVVDHRNGNRSTIKRVLKEGNIQDLWGE